MLVEQNNEFVATMTIGEGQKKSEPKLALKIIRFLELVTRTQHHLQAAQTLKKLISNVFRRIQRNLFAPPNLGDHLHLFINIFTDEPSARLIPLHSCARIS